MSDTIFVKPARAGLVVRDPATRQKLAADGESKRRTPYWLRRIADGDVKVVTPAPKAPAPPSAAASSPAPPATENVQVKVQPDGSEVIHIPAPAKAPAKK